MGAIQWGGWDYGGGNGMRVGIEVDVSSVSHGSGSVKFTYRVWTENQYTYDDPQTLEYGGSHDGGDYDFTNRNGSGATLRHTKTFTYNYSSTSYGRSPGSTTFSARIGGAYNGVSPSKEVRTTIPARPVDNPAPPSNATLTRLADNHVRLNWRNNATAGEPYESLGIDRKIGESGSWDYFTSPAPNRTSWDTFDRIDPNRAYQYRLYSRNSASRSDYAYTNTVYTTPAAPGSPSATLNTSGTVTVRWTNRVGFENYTIRVDRKIGENGDWVQMATGGAGTTSRTDTNPGNGDVQYRIIALAPGGLGSAYTYTNYVNTVPGAPSNVRATTRSDNTIRLTWTNNVAYSGYTIYIERQVNGGSWSVAAQSLSGGTTSFIDTSPGAGSNRYRIRTSGINSQDSAFTLSNTVSTIVPPLAPTNLSPSNSALFETGSQITFTWRHNDGGDGADQSQFQQRFSTNNGASWTEMSAVTSDVSSTTRALTASTAYLWQVRTKGVDPEWSPWSASATIVQSTKPTATLSATVPPSTLTTWPARATWTYAQADGSPQASWEARLYEASSMDASLLRETRTGAGASTATFEHPVRDSATYTVAVRLRSGAGLWSDWATRTFTVNLLPPALLVLDPAFDPETGTVTIGVTADAARAGETAAVDRFTIERRIDGGDWVPVVVDVDYETELTVLDTAPITHGVNEYRAQVVSTAPSTDTSATYRVEVDGIEGGQRLFLSYGPGFGQVLSAECDPKTSESRERAKAATPALGRRKPIGQFGEQRQRTVSVAATLHTPDPRRCVQETVTRRNVAQNPSLEGGNYRGWVTLRGGSRLSEEVLRTNWISRDTSDWGTSALVQRDPTEVVQWRNLMPNPGFETTTSGLLTGSATTASRGSGNSISSGSFGLSVSVSGASTSNGYVTQAVPISAASGAFLGVSAKVRRSAGIDFARWYVTWYDASGAYMNLSDASGYTALENRPMADIVPLTHVFAVPTGAAEVRIWLRFAGSVDGGTAPADGAVHTDDWIAVRAGTEAAARAAVQTFFDGDTPATSTFTYRWTGTVGQSQSEKVRRLPASSAAWKELLTVGTSIAYLGSPSPWGSTLPVNDREVRTASANVLNPGSRPVQARLAVWQYSSSNVQLSRSDGTTVTIQPGSTTTIENIFTPVEGCTGARYLIYLLNEDGQYAPDLTLWLRRLYLGRAGAWFNGDTSSTGMLRYRWTGTRGESPSEEYAVPTIPDIVVTYPTGAGRSPTARRQRWATGNVGGGGTAYVHALAPEEREVGRQVTGYLWVQSSAAKAMRVQAVLSGGSGSTSTVNGETVQVPANTWTRLSVTRTIDRGDRSALTLRAETTDSFGTGETLDVDTAQIQFDAAAPTGYFDGDSAPTDTFGYRWEGEPNESASEEFTPLTQLTQPGGSSSRDEFLTASDEADVVLYRDYTGRRVFGQLSSVDADDTYVHFATISFTVTEIDYRETGYTLSER